MFDPVENHLNFVLNLLKAGPKRFWCVTILIIYIMYKKTIKMKVEMMSVYEIVKQIYLDTYFAAKLANT